MLSFANEQDAVTQRLLSVGDVTTSISPDSIRLFAGGRRGNIYRAECNGVPVVLKCMRVYHVWTTEARVRHRRALLESWMKLDHPNILELLGVCEYRPLETFGLVLPWMEQGTVTTYLARNPDAERSPLVLDVVQGLRYLHSLNPIIVHGHVKAANIFIRTSGVACLADFTRSSYNNDKDGNDWRISAGEIGAGQDNARWTAPEYYKPERYNLTEVTAQQPPLDIFSLGMMMYEIYAGRLPYEKKVPWYIMCDVIADKRPSSQGWYQLEDPVSARMWEIAQECWHDDWRKRPTAAQLSTRLGHIVRPRSQPAAGCVHLSQEEDPSFSSGSGSDDELPDPAPAPRFPMPKGASLGKSPSSGRDIVRFA